MFEIICEICGENDWTLFGDKEGKIKEIHCKNDPNRLNFKNLQGMFVTAEAS